MNVEEGQEQNGRYLSASLKWLRLRLEQLERVGDSPKLAAPSFFGHLFGRRSGDDTNDTQPAHRDLRERITQAEAERAAAAQMEPPPALIILGQQLGLTEFERDILLLCVAMELDTRIAGLCARAQGDPGRPYPTFALAMSLFETPSWDALSPHRPLRYWRLIEINQPGATPLTHSALRADERITNFVKGLNALDDRLANWLTVLHDPVQLSPSQQEAVDTILWHWRRAPSAGPLSIAQLLGSDGQSKRLVAGQTAAVVGRQLYGVAADELPTVPSDLDLFARLWQRESLLLPLALYIDAQSHELAVLDRFLTRAADSNGLLMLGVRDAMPELAATSFTVDVARPALAEQREAWLQSSAALTLAAAGEQQPAEGPGDERLANQLASQFNFNLPDIWAIAEQAGPLDQAADSQFDVWERCRSKTRPRLDTLAQRLAPKATWDDLVTPEEPGRLLHAIADQVRNRATVYEDWGFARRMNRGMGISALFAGESGTGKTMAAEVIANDLRLDLYRIDLSAVVSKYIGETEKNLRRLFDAAEDGGAILFFDEADALFGKRSEVKDSHDRYANIEINYLLQRMEAYSGLAILATNMKTALDQAFMRRLRFVVTFTFPGVAERKAIWLKVFPPEAPLAALDYDRLARLNLTGGNIHSIALNAAFLAARNGSPVTMALVLAAARTELRKLERPINEADFRA